MISRIFIERPRLAMVISIIIVLAGALALLNIPVAQYPRVTPPVVKVSASYPGANAEVVADSVAAPLEAEVNGVDNMLYMSGTASNNGQYDLEVTFAVGTDPDIAQVNVQNRVQQALSKLPTEVTSQGVDVRKSDSNMMLIFNFYSPKGTRDELFLSNYVSINVKDALKRVNGISDASIFGAMDYSMRVWMDPERLTALGLTADDVIAAIEKQNVQAAVGSVGTSPSDNGQQVQYTLRARGRLKSVSEFERIVVRANARGGIVRIGDVARVELGAEQYGSGSNLNGMPSTAMAVYRSPGANALDVVNAALKEVERLSESFPSDMEYQATYDTTKFVRAGIKEIITTLLITFALVVAVTYLFLQDMRATLIPSLTIPVSLVGTFAGLLALGFSANTITLFALILAIGLVVDDAIVVVENVQRVLQEEGLSPREATLKSMKQVTGPVIATTLVLLAVFVPVGFMPGITGKLYQQFAVTICIAVLLSSVNALTLTPALCALLLRPVKVAARGPLAWFSALLNGSRNVYLKGVSFLVRRMVVAGLLFIAIGGVTYKLFVNTPTSFLPDEDQGYYFVDVQLPESATKARTEEVLANVDKMIRGFEGVRDVITVSGFSIIAGTSENVGLVVIVLDPWDMRAAPHQQLGALMGMTMGGLAGMPEARLFPFAPPAIQGLGETGGFDFRLQALNGQSPRELAEATYAFVGAANQDPAIAMAFTTYSANLPQLYVDLDRTKAEMMEVPVSRIFSTLQSQLGGRYVNDFNLFSRVFQVKVQADLPHRDGASDIHSLYVRSDTGKMIPLNSLATLDTVLGPQSVSRYNQFPTAQINGQAAPGVSSGEAMAALERLAAETLPEGYAFEWSSLSYQEKRVGNQGPMLIALALLFGYLFLVAQYESWTIPLPVILSISVAAMGALAALALTRLPLSIYAQIGLVLLVGLASKNAILIVEFAKEEREAGLSVFEAAMSAARLRYRAVLMTAFSFILGVFPLVIATGAGAGSRRAIGTTVFGGMLAATVLGIFLIPALYAIFQSAREKIRGKRGGGAGGGASEKEAREPGSVEREAPIAAATVAGASFSPGDPAASMDISASADTAGAVDSSVSRPEPKPGTAGIATSGSVA